MSADDGLRDEMRRFFARRPDSLHLDDVTVARLLSGRVDPADAPPDYASVARVIRAAGASTRPDELAGEAHAVATFRAARNAEEPAATRHPRLRLAAIVTAGVLLLGGVAGAASTGSLPDGSQSVDHDALGAVSVSVPTPGAAPRARSAATRQSPATAPTARAATPRPALAPRAPRLPPTVPRTRPPTDGLLLAACRAYSQGRVSLTGGRDAPNVYRYLEGRAGGAANIAAYCRGVVNAARP